VTVHYRCRCQRTFQESSRKDVLFARDNGCLLIEFAQRMPMTEATMSLLVRQSDAHVTVLQVFIRTTKFLQGHPRIPESRRPLAALWRVGQLSELVRLPLVRTQRVSPNPVPSSTSDRSLPLLTSLLPSLERSRLEFRPLPDISFDADVTVK
jgi:hypothetical protein